MPKIIPAAIRQAFVEFDPETSTLTVEQFCQRLGISPRSFYRIRAHYVQHCTQALRPTGSTPKNPHRIDVQHTADIVVGLHHQLRHAGRALRHRV